MINEKNNHIIQVFSNLFEQSIKNTIISQKKKKHDKSLIQIQLNQSNRSTLTNLVLE